MSLCGYAGITTPEEFAELGFDAQLQCVNGFEQWLSDYVDVKCLPFDDCAAIPQKIYISAQKFLSKHYDRGSRILISCAAGESRSVCMAIGLLFLKGGSSFLDACKEVFSKVPTAYPHPNTLVSLANHCGIQIDLSELKSIYANIVIQPPFPWSDDDINDAILSSRPVFRHP